MSKQKTEEKKAIENRYFRSRKEYSDTYYDLAKGKRNWQLMAFWSIGIAAVCIIAFIMLATKTKITPYVVEVDKTGQPVQFGPAEQIKPTDERIIRAEVFEFMKNIRTIYSDPASLSDMVNQAYSMVGDKARNFLNGYFSKPQNDPRLLAKKIRRNINITSIILIGDNNTKNNRSYKVSWTETRVPITSGVYSRRAWEGYLDIKISPPSSTEGIQKNPLGIFIENISWSPISTNVQN